GSDIGHGISDGSDGEQTGAGRGSCGAGDVQIQQLQTLVAEMSSRKGTLMQCILRMDRRLADLEKRPLEP
nr:hypothetical protein [Tanacetum cinerariifolium]